MLKLGSDRADRVSVDLHQRQLDVDGAPFSVNHHWDPLRSPKNDKRPFRNSEASAAVGHERPDNAISQVAPKRTSLSRRMVMQ